MTRNSLLHFPIPPELREEWATHLAKRAHDVPVGQVAMIVFRLGAEHFCLPAGSVEEITVVGVIRPLPHRQNGIIHGITNVRGQIRTCVRLDRLVQVLPSSTAATPSLMVLHHENWHVATVVDEVIGILEFDLAARQPLPSTHSGAVYCDGFFTGDVGVIASLNETKLFTGLRQQLR